MMTKFIEGAREIEMDAVAKDGKVCEVLPYVKCFFLLSSPTSFPGLFSVEGGGWAGNKIFARRFWL